MKKVIAVYPGTFDPITFGHLDIIERTSKVFAKLIIAVAEDNPKSPIFTVQERLELIETQVRKRYNENVTVQHFNGLLVDFVRSQGSSVIVRGLRAATDFEYEFQLSFMNHKLAPDIQTMFIPANEKGHFISSRIVKEVARLGGNLSTFVPKEIEEKLKQYYAKH
jgi:pantetheine-phosphate adenylyltransferase